MSRKSREDDSILNGTESILFVDDDKAIAGMSKIMLENLGYHVNSKTSSIDALVDFKRQPEKYDLVITDLTMPQMTGLELADEILSVRPDTPIILCTGLSARQTSSDSRREGIQAVLAKPILSRTMSGTIRSVMKKNVSADCGERLTDAFFNPRYVCSLRWKPEWDQNHVYPYLAKRIVPTNE